MYEMVTRKLFGKEESPEDRSSMWRCLSMLNCKMDMGSRIPLTHLLGRMHTNGQLKLTRTFWVNCPKSPKKWCPGEDYLRHRRTSGCRIGPNGTRTCGLTRSPYLVLSTCPNSMSLW